ncbi:PIN domain protein [uncultured archaeon]|nr:PIN domain protein [uncultured archaeon]
MDNAIFVDSWAFVALANKDDPRNDLARRRFNSITKKKLKWFVSDYILDEAITQIFQDTCSHDHKCSKEAYNFVNNIFESISNNWIVLEWINENRLDSARSLRDRFSDKPDISFTDLTSFVVMKELGIRNVFSGDGHFEKVNMGFNIWREEL